jgi:hypothetical protein
MSNSLPETSGALSSKSNSLRTFWSVLLELLEWLGRCALRAFFPSRVIGFMSGIVLIAGLIVPWILYTHQNWSSQYQAWFTLVSLCYVPIGLAALFLVSRLVVSPFLIHRDDKAKHVQAVSGLVSQHQAVAQERDEVKKQLEARRPDFEHERRETRIITSFAWDGQKQLARANFEVAFLNMGIVPASSCKIEVYACWLATPANVIYIPIPEITGRVPVGRTIIINFEVSQTAANLGLNTQGQPVWGFGDPQLCLWFEIESRAGSAIGGTVHNEPILCRWTSYFPQLLTYETPQVRALVEPHVQRVKSERQTMQLL